MPNPFDDEDIRGSSPNSDMIATSFTKIKIIK